MQEVYRQERERTKEKIAYYANLTDAEVEALKNEAMAIHPELAVMYEGRSAAEIRQWMIESIEHDAKLSSEERNDAYSVMKVLDTTGCQAAKQLWENCRLLPAPSTFYRAAAMVSDDASAFEGHLEAARAAVQGECKVNATVWPARPPFKRQEECGGVQQPWEFLLKCYDLACLRPCTNARGAVASLADCAGPLRVFAAAAGALRRLQTADAISVELDVGDVVTYPRRESMRAARAGGSADGSFDRIHLNNVPDYISMLPVLTELVPCLKAHQAAWLTHNIMLATSLYTEQAANYTYASLLMHPGPLTRQLFGARRSV